MTVAIECVECESEVPFTILEPKKSPTATCNKCGEKYELEVKKIV